MKLPAAYFVSTLLVFSLCLVSPISASMPGESQEVLLLRTGNAEPTVRSDAANVLKRYGDSRVEARLIDMTQDPDWRVRFDAVKTLGRFGDSAATPHVIPLVQDPMPHVRMIAVWCLAQIGDLDGVPVIIEAVKDSDPQVRQMAQRALKNISETRQNRSLEEWNAWWIANKEIIAASWIE